MATTTNAMAMMVIIGVLLIHASADTTLNQVAVSDPKALCLDGSPYSYYISQGTNATKFYIYHEGGGWCQTLEECAQRAQTALGSSVNWTSTMTATDSFSRDPNDNPLMNGWTLIYLPYCDGGSFTGDAQSTSGPQLYFYGLGIREAVVASLQQSYGFNDATDLVIGGCSAGGLAAYLHADWWASQAPNAFARALPDSGFFLDGNYTRDGKPDYEWRMSNLYEFMNSQAGISADCAAAIGYKCLFAYNVLPYVKTPVFALNSAYDATMGDGPCGHSGIIFDWNNATSVNECGNYIRGLVQKLLAAPSAAFLDSCQHHCGEWGAIHIDNITGPNAMNVWYGKGVNALPNAGYLDQNQVYPCTSCCSD